MPTFDAWGDRVLYALPTERTMIKRTFLLLPGIGQVKERRLW